MAFVNVCPKNEHDVIQASKRLECGFDIYGNNQYMCIPNKEKTSLVEFCFQGVMGIVEKGNCLEFSEGEYIPHNCNQFSHGCPKAHFYDYDIYKHPACQNINTELQCYVLDLNCTAQSNTEASPGQDYVIYIVVILGSVLLFIVCFIVIKKCYKRWKTMRKKIEYDDEFENVTDETEHPLTVEYDDENVTDETEQPPTVDENEMGAMLKPSVTGDQKEESKEHTHCNKRKSNQKNGAMESQQNNGTGGTLQRSMDTVLEELTKKQNEKDKT